MNENVPKQTHFSYCHYPPKLSSKDQAPTIDDKQIVTTRSEPSKAASNRNHRKSSSLKISNPINKEVATNLINTDIHSSIFQEKKWRTCVQENNKFVHLNRLFLPPLESVSNLSLPPNVNINCGTIINDPISTKSMVISPRLSKTLLIEKVI